MKLDFTPQIEVISSLVMRGASIPVLSRRLKLKSHCAIARWLAENRPELYIVARANGVANQKAPAKGRIF